jgi:hypothetical protein
MRCKKTAMPEGSRFFYVFNNSMRHMSAVPAQAAAAE